MLFQVNNTLTGYIVEAYVIGLIANGKSLLLTPNGIGHWHPLMNFGQNQGDAILFKDSRCPKLSLQELIALANNYNPKDIYAYHGPGRFEKAITKPSKTA